MLLQEGFRADEGALTGRVLVGCSHGLAATALPPLLEATAREHPGIEVGLALGAQDDLLARLNGGEIDLVVLPGSRLPRDLHTHVLFHAPVHVILPPDHRLAARDEIRLTELIDEPYVMLETSPAREHALAMFEAVGAVPDVRYSSESFELTRSLVARGLGVSLQMQRPWGDRSYEGRPLCVRPVDPGSPGESVVLVRPKGIRLSRPADAFATTAARLSDGADDQPSPWPHMTYPPLGETVWPV